MNDAPLSREERLRRAAKVCLHFARNKAYYRAALEGEQWLTPDSNFWRTTTGNFIDTAVLEWCKVFADPKERQHWRRIVSDQSAFESSFYSGVGVDEAEFDLIIKRFKFYRDKFLAHLDSERVMHVPLLDAPWSAVSILYDWVLYQEMTPDEAARVDVPCARTYYRECFDEARALYLSL